jgi:hypothetical protein
MVRVQLVVAQPQEVPQLCVLVGPTFRDILAALQSLPRRAYVAPNYWIVDRVGLARLRAAGLQLEAGTLEPVLRELAHRAALSLAHDWLPLYQPASSTHSRE